MSAELHPIYQNALDAICLGVEDFMDKRAPRLASAVRNLTAGLLLLCKEKLRRMSPDDEILIWKNLKPVPGDGSPVKFVPSGQATVDVPEIEARFKAFDVCVDMVQLKRVAAVRNKLEHHYVEKQEEVIGAFVDGFHFLRHFLPVHLGTDPVEALGESAWEELLEQSAVFESMLKACDATFECIDAKKFGSTLGALMDSKCCRKCGSRLLRQVDEENSEVAEIRFKCETCGKEDTFEAWVRGALSEHFAVDSFLAVKDGGEPPVHTCPECGNETYVLEDGECLACVFRMQRGAKCGVCGEYLTLDDYSEGNNLCSYHRYVIERERDS